MLRLEGEPALQVEQAGAHRGPARDLARRQRILGGANRVADVVKDESADTPYEQLEEKTNSALVHEMVETLDAREKAILRQRFGLDGDERKTLEEIGEQFGVTRERIRQIEEIALKKLRKRIQDLDTVQFAA